MFLALAIGFWIGPKKLAGFSLGSVTATLLAAVAIGQLGIQVPGPIKSTFFLLFLFAVGYGVGPQFFRGLSKDGPKQILFSLIVLALCLLVPFVCASSPGSTSATRSACTPARRRSPRRSASRRTRSTGSGLPPEQAKAYLDAIPVGYAVTYIFGTIGSAIVLAQLGPKLIGVDLPAACAEYEKQMGGGQVGPRSRRVLRLSPDRAARLPHRRGERPHRQAGARAVPGLAHLRRAHPPRRPASSTRTPTACSSRATSSRSRARATRWSRRSKPSCRKSTTARCSTCRSRWSTCSCAARR